MLVLSRKPGQKITIGDDIEIEVLSVRGDVVRIGINAPKEVRIGRPEQVAKVTEENRAAAAAAADPAVLARLLSGRRPSADATAAAPEDAEPGMEHQLT